MKKLLLVSTALTVFFAGSALAADSDGQLRLIHQRRRHPRSSAGPASTSVATSVVPGQGEP